MYSSSNFREHSPGEFTNRNTGGNFLSPVTVITKTALNRVVDGSSVELPAGYDMTVLDNIYYASGYAERDLRLSGRQAVELRTVGRSILELDAKGMIQPPLTHDEATSIRHLDELVSRMQDRYEQSVKKEADQKPGSFFFLITGDIIIGTPDLIDQSGRTIDTDLPGITSDQGLLDLLRIVQPDPARSVEERREMIAFILSSFHTEPVGQDQRQRYLLDGGIIRVLKTGK